LELEERVVWRCGKLAKRRREKTSSVASVFIVFIPFCTLHSFNELKSFIIQVQVHKRWKLKCVDSLGFTISREQVELSNQTMGKLKISIRWKK
jgi:hypothetical protein